MNTPMTTPQEEAREDAPKFATIMQGKLLVSIKEFEEMEKNGIQMEITNPFIKNLLTRVREEGVESAIEAVKTAHALGHDRNRAEPDAQHLISREETLKALTALKSKP